MRRSGNVTLAMLTSSWLVAACGMEEAPLYRSTGALTVDNKIAANKLALNKLASNKIVANKIAANKLASNKIVANKIALNGTTDELLASEDGRAVLGALVGCAVPEDTILVAEVDGTTYEFPGAVGLAPSWIDHPLTEKARRWVSACLFARVNAHDVSVQISMRGPHRALAVTEEERAQWTLEEGAFYGNYFTPDDQPIEWIACRGRDQATAETGDLVDRDCAEADPAHPGLSQCGFWFAGDCGSFAPDHACEHHSRKKSYYRDCHDQPQAKDGDDEPCDEEVDDGEGARGFREVITTFVRP